MSADRRSEEGFSLVEVLVVLALAAVLLSLALPNYREQVARTRRVQAQAGLLEDAQSMQRYYAANNTYENATDASLATARTPREGDVASYTLSVMATPPTLTGWTLVATPVGPMTGDRCGSLTLDSLGVKGATGTAPVAECWR